jgi:hypothetical protein
MSVTYPSTIIDGRLQVVITAIGAAGKVQLGTAGMALVVSTVILPNPPATVSSGVLTFSGTPLVDPAAAFSGFVTAARITNSAGSPVITGLTVTSTSGGGDILINLQNVTAGSIVTFVSGTITGR